MRAGIQGISVVSFGLIPRSTVPLGEIDESPWTEEPETGEITKVATFNVMYVGCTACSDQSNVWEAFADQNQRGTRGVRPGNHKDVVQSGRLDRTSSAQIHDTVVAVRQF